MKNTLMILLFLFPTLFFSQKFKAGLILPINKEDISTDEFCCVLSPKEGFTVYKAPNGVKSGILKMLPRDEKDSQIPYKLYYFKNNFKIEVEDIEAIGYDYFALEYTEILDGFVKVNYNVNGWLSIKEMNDAKFEIVDWKQYLLLNKNDVLGYYANDPGLNLRAKPDANAAIVGSVRGELFEIQIINKTSGQWCFVKVTKRKEHQCNTDFDDSENIEFVMEGWMKIIDDNGKPNLWSYLKGC